MWNVNQFREITILCQKHWEETFSQLCCLGDAVALHWRTPSEKEMFITSVTKNPIHVLHLRYGIVAVRGKGLVLLVKGHFFIKIFMAVQTC